LAVVALALFGQLVALSHMGLVHHELCLEHDALVEARAIPHAQDGIGSNASSSFAAFAQGDADDHCVAATLTQSTGAVLPWSFVHALPAVTALIRTVQGPVALARVRDVLAVAPKQGPPVHITL
jgi:hypothetical protein